MQKISSRKKMIFSLILIVCAYVMLECFAFVGYLAVKRQFFSLKQYQTYRLALIAPERVETDSAGGFYKREMNLPFMEYPEAIHPYLGYVIDPTKAAGISEYGFLGQGIPIHPRDERTLIIGIVGGSFAAGTSTVGDGELIEIFKHYPEFAQKEIIVHTLAMGGYKQPQQLFTLIYLLTLGGHFDMIINIDGFNEVALPPTENIPNQVFAFYPRNWFGRVYNIQNDRKLLLTVGEIAQLVERRKIWARSFSSFPLRYSILGNFIWKYYDKKLFYHQYEKEMTVRNYQLSSNDAMRYVVTGPSFDYPNEPDLYYQLAQHWKRCSLQLYNVCLANGIQYYHFLQPNQYVAGSKIMRQEERELAVADSPYGHAVEQGYASFIKEGKELQKMGVPFYDLSMIFANTDAPLYSDNCCHLNENGYKIIIRHIADVIVTHHRETRQP